MTKVGTIYTSVECPKCACTNVSRYVSSVGNPNLFICRCNGCGHDYEEERSKSEFIPDYNICKYCKVRFYAEHDYPICIRCNDFNICGLCFDRYYL
jgi:hypothetical protein